MSNININYTILIALAIAQTNECKIQILIVTCIAELDRKIHITTLKLNCELEYMIMSASYR